MQSAVSNEYTYETSYNESVAYDLSRFDQRRSVREALENEPSLNTHGDTAYAPAARPAANAAAKAQPRGFRISAFMVLSYFAIFAMLLMIVMNYMRLNEKTVQTSRCADELSDLQSELSMLQVRYEQKQNVSDIKNRAADLGLFAPTSAQITYIDLSKPDYAIIYTEADNAGALKQGLYRFAKAIGSFFE